MTTTANSLMTELTEAFAAQGHTGNELTRRVCAAGVVAAMLLKMPDAEAHFKARVKELSAPAPGRQIVRNFKGVDHLKSCTTGTLPGYGEVFIVGLTRLSPEIHAVEFIANVA